MNNPPVKSHDSFSQKLTYLLGFGFFATSLAWGVYNAFVPLFLDDFIQSKSLLGWVMTFDNIFAVALIPVIGALSDKTRTKFGRRMPYIMAAMPLSAFFMAIIPFYISLPMLMVMIIGMNMSMSIYRGPVIALMPDLTPEKHRSRANGIINFMGDVGSVLAYGAGSLLYKMDSRLPFIFCAAVVLFSLTMLMVFIKEPKEKFEKSESELKGINKLKGKDVKAILPALTSIFLWFLSYQAVESMFSLYGVNYLSVDESAAAFSVTFFSLSFLVFAIPAGFIGQRFGKWKTISAGIIGMTFMYAAMIFLKDLLAIRIAMGIGGFFWACININSYPLIVERAGLGSIGAYTGLYYLFSQSSSIVSPPLAGLFIDMYGYKSLFMYSSAAIILAFFCFLFARHKKTPVQAD